MRNDPCPDCDSVIQSQGHIERINHTGERVFVEIGECKCSIWESNGQDWLWERPLPVQASPGKDCFVVSDEIGCK